MFTCPVKNSVQGVIQYNTPTIYSGTKFENVRLEFKDGKVIKATSNNNKRLNEILDTDAGARYIGEFSLGFNPYIMNPMCDILFDEKIAGSLHFTPGQAYEDADNGNRSAVHWDMVLIQRPEWGGGEEQQAPPTPPATDTGIRGPRSPCLPCPCPPAPRMRNRVPPMAKNSPSTVARATA